MTIISRAFANASIFWPSSREVDFLAVRDAVYDGGETQEAGGCGGLTGTLEERQG